MVIKMIQERTPADHASSPIQYSFLYKNNKISSFFAQNPPMLQSTGFENAFNADYKGQRTIKVRMEKNNECPPGYVEKLLVYNTQESDGTKKSISKYSYNYYDVSINQKIGSLSYITIVPPKKKFFDFFRAYEYQSLNYCGNIYNAYYVVVGQVGIFYCIHQNNQLVAMIQKDPHVEQFKDNYTIYALNNIDFDALCLIASHFDYTNFEEAMPKVEKNTTTYAPMNTEHRKEVFEKYDPTFIQKIIELENQQIYNNEQ